VARPAKYDDDTVIDRAMHLVWRRGWSATSIRDLEAELDLAAPAIYRRFGSKDGLAAAVLDHYVERVVRVRIGRYLPGHGDPVDNVRTFFTSGVRQRGGAPLLGCLLVDTALDGVDAHPALAGALHDALAEIDTAIGAEMERAERAGRLRPGTTATQATAVLTFAWHGVMVLARAGRSPTSLRRRIDAAIDAVTVPVRADEADARHGGSRPPRDGLR
jgi:TetR/AcrR family transcriptional repressor of nem operon